MQFLIYFFNIVLKYYSIRYIIAFDYKNLGEVNMKKVLSLLLVFIIVAMLFSGCSSAPNGDMTENNVKNTVGVAFDALKAFDIDALNTYVKSSTLSQIMTYAQEHEQFKKLGQAIFANLEYEIVDIDLDAGLVTLSVKNKDLEEAAKNYLDGLLDEYTLLDLLALISDDSWLDNNLSVLTNSIDDCEMNTEPVEVTLKIKEGGSNLILRFGADAENAVSGGALGAIKSIIPF